MSKLVWVENRLLFKINKSFRTQTLCICNNGYKEELGLEIGDIVFIRDETKSRSFRRLGPIKAFSTPNKVIIGVMPDLGIGCKNKMELLHNQSL